MRFASLSAWPYVAVIMELWLVLLSEKSSSTSRVEVLNDMKMLYVNCGVKN